MVRVKLRHACAELQVQDEKGWAPIHVCGWKDNSHITDVILRSGRCDVNIKTNNGNTALHWVCAKALFLRVLLHVRCRR